MLIIENLNLLYEKLLGFLNHSYFKMVLMVFYDICNNYTQIHPIHRRFHF